MKLKTIFLAAVILTALVLMSGTALAANTIYVDQAYFNAYATDDNTKFSDMDADYILTENIDLSGVTNWKPIGPSHNFYFNGTFDGGGYTISGLTINDPASVNLGLFGVAADASFSNVTLKNFNITGQSYLGSLIGLVSIWEYENRIDNVTVIDCNITGSDLYAGGLVGSFQSNYNGMIDNCSATGKVTAGGQVGGLAGTILYSSIQNSYANCTVNATYIPADLGPNQLIYGSAGGLAGSITNSAVSTCYTAGNVQSASDKAGGLFGLTSSLYAVNLTTISNCYSVCDVSAEETYAGGLVGLNTGEYINSISNCYFAGAVYVNTINGEIGGIVGGVEEDDALHTYPDPKVTDCIYLDVDDSYYTNAFGLSATSRNMKKITTYLEDSVYLDIGSTGWDIVSAYDPGHIWYILEGKTFPLLSIFYVPPSNGGGDGTGEAVVVDPIPVKPDVEENDAGNVTGNATGSGGIDGGKVIEEEGYEIEEETSKIPCLFWLLLLLLLLLIIAYYFYKRSQRNEE
ncbi:GLUG motif-containing protein [Methanimicrococcus blatticola]|uniref:GLUG motif-containing protein n=1 Tax=Methanimicrococcus blatticola TaxID=91560 RepID=A0A484F3F5_9EURY|nr:GLUG motif-containing protein [Methanimicrococcus blatticola]MBZ3935423.1 hypothetical protein [Methanimicrococcus blatticola]MCC2508480.1 hypothetical protein [Methanimicrococcus blatticola]TDQ67789.1 GLUG motif-containing protein [Methanimicrococcus blatticola]